MKLFRPSTLAISLAVAMSGHVPVSAAVIPSAADDGSTLIRVDSGVAPGRSDLELVEDYGAFALYRAHLDADAVLPDGVRRVHAAHALAFSAESVDTRVGVASARGDFTLAPGDRPGLHVVQFVGPVRSAWLDALTDIGVVPVQYVASNGYIVWADAPALSALERLMARVAWLPFRMPLHAHLKVDPLLHARLDSVLAADTQVDVVVQVYAGNPQADQSRVAIEAFAQVPVDRQAPVGPGMPALHWTPVLAFENLAMRVRVADIPALAARPEVSFVGEALPMRLMDERQGIVMTGDFAPSAESIDYLQFLRDRSFSEVPGDYPVVDITDSPVHEGGSGATVLDTADRKLREGGLPDGASRVVAFTNCSTLPDAQVGDDVGHGSINAGIIAGFDQRGGWPFQDGYGHQLGLGINPFVRIGSTAVFTPGYSLAGCGGSHSTLIKANWDSGARISNNAWGSSSPPATYDAGQQAYDAGVRDADPVAAFNQQMIYVFSAGNLGPGGNTMSSPAGAKNVITVGASENVRPDWLDGCGADGGMADNPNDAARFSSRGPAPGGRIKPETIAPGTHIQGGASNFPGYNGSGVCDKYHPEGQTEFASSSGTSHSAPAVAGLASLAWWWIEQGGAGAAAGTVDRIERVDAPSPALLKAWLMAHPAWLDGDATGDNLPSNVQGFGMPDIGSMFDTTAKVVIDQSELFVETGETLEYRWAVADPARPVRVALAYTDAPGALGTSPQVNDLDLRVQGSGQTWLGNRFSGGLSVPGGDPDPYNNYEAVFLPPGMVEDVRITVLASNVAADAVKTGAGPSQDFALVCYNCERTPGFTLGLEQSQQHVCAAGLSETVVEVASIAGFDAPVTLSASSTLPGFTAQFLPNPVAADGQAQFRFGAPSGATTGIYELLLTGSSGALSKSRALSLQVFDTIPTASPLTGPADGDEAVSLQPTLSWEPQPDALSYHVQIATDPAFRQVVLETETTQTSWVIDSRDALDSSRRYWWRVVVRNPCGDSAALAPSADTVFRDGFEGAPVFDDARSFVTVALPLDCAVDVVPVSVYADDLEGGAGDWVTGAAAISQDLWSLGSAARSGQWGWQMLAPEAGQGNDQWLVSPALTLPTDLVNLRLQFWQRSAFKSGTGASCQDGGLIEVSTNDGASWTQVVAGIHGQAYDGSMSAAFQNPLGGRQAWCGDPRDYTRTVVNLGAYVGQTVKLRFRAGHDRFAHRRGVNWAIDDILVRGCPAP